MATHAPRNTTTGNKKELELEVFLNENYSGGETYFKDGKIIVAMFIHKQLLENNLQLTKIMLLTS